MTDGRNGQQAEAHNGTRLADVMASAQQEFESMTGRKVEGVSSVRRRENGWALCLEVVELRRVPDSTSILGTYETFVDSDGAVIEYERTGRYYRNQASDTDSI